ncbi:MAG: hypothetical protein U0570_11655 [Phycisphaerales bacterium]
MKLKGINPIEQHVEKIVVILVGLVLLGVIAQQFLTSPNEVKVGSDTVPPGQAYGPVKRAADVLKAKLETQSPTLPEGFDKAGKDMQAEFKKFVAGGVSPRPAIAPLGPAVALGATSVKMSDALFAEVVVPQPSQAVAASFWATISPEEVAAYPELAAILPKEQPFDHPFVSVESSIDVKAFVESLTNDPDGSGPLEAMPQGWWREGIEAINVEAEREQRNSDGSWGKGVVLPAMLGRHLFIVGWNDSVKSTGDMQSQIVNARQQSGEILRPAFYKTLGNQEWVAPSAAASRAKAGFDPAQLAAKQAELEKVRTELAAKKDELAKLPKDEPKKPEPPKPADKNAPKPPTTPPAPTPPPAKPETNVNAERNRLNNAIRGLENRERLLADEVARLNPQGTEATPAGTQPATVASFLSQDNVKFWIHDATAQPGETYRYRVRIGVNNPLFGRAALLQPPQQNLATNSVIKSPWSDWSNSVDVDRSEYFFVTAATPDSDMGAARASVELFKFYFGHYRKQTAGMNIGDPLSGTINLPKNLAAAPAAPANPANPAAPGNPAGTAAPADAPPAPSFTVPDNIRVTLDGVILLDIAPVPNATGAPAFIAVLRDINGNVILRSPDRDRESPLYKRVDASARSAGG